MGLIEIDSQPHIRTGQPTVYKMNDDSVVAIRSATDPAPEQSQQSNIFDTVKQKIIDVKDYVSKFSTNEQLLYGGGLGVLFLVLILKKKK